MRFYIKTLGCKQNSSESELIKEHLEGSGMTWSDNEPDMIIVHSCAVTNKAEYKSRDAVRRLKRKFPKARVIVIGCAAQNSPHAFREIGADLLLDNDEKFHLSNYLEGEGDDLSISKRILSRFASQSRAFLSIQDGCDLSCAYCIITKLRGPSISKPKDVILEEIEHLKSAGHHEIVLTGINTGLWGRDLGSSFNDLVRELSVFNGIRYRLSSLNPDMIDDELIFLIGEENSICPHLHISLQSASEKVLRGQRRFYRPEKFRDITLKLKDINEYARIGLDIIAGLPLEDGTEFKNSVAMLKESQVDYMHIFRFSPRKGTDSAEMDFPKGDISKERAAMLNELDRGFRIAFLEKNIGRDCEVILENRKDKKGAVIGMTDNYLDVGVFGDSQRGVCTFKGEYIENGRLYGK